MSESTRREFLRRTLLGATAVGAGLDEVAQASLTGPTTTQGAEAGKTVDRRVLGRVGAEVSILGLGLGAAFTRPHAGRPEQVEALLQRALACGVNYWDTSHSYGSRGIASEEMIGPTVKYVRKQIFLVSKSTQRSYDGFKREMEISLKRLQTDHLDVYHIHSLRPGQDADLGAIEKGAVRAARQAKEQGVIGHFGVTGHAGADILVEAVRRWDPDVLLTIFPATRPDNGKYEDSLLPLARERKMGIVGMKTVKQASDADLKGTDLIRYALSLEGVHCVEVGLDSMAHLDENAAMAADFTPLSRKEQTAVHREITLALAGATAPWEMPGYVDGATA